jgi:hypothetical protein
MALLMTFPVYGFKKIADYLKNPSNRQAKDAANLFIEDNRINTKPRAFYTIIFLLRRIIISFMLVLGSYPFF